MVRFEVIDRAGEKKEVEVPSDINLNLMEVLKACDYPVLATCGGMALCATCHVFVNQGSDQLNDPSDAELNMLDTLPIATSLSRLACQVKIGKNLHGAVFTLRGDGNS
jgi:2Fe-2S ferredoxin